MFGGIKTKKCDKCSRNISVNNFVAHFQSCDPIKKKKTSSLSCEFCFKTFSTSSGRGVHEPQCKRNPNGVIKKYKEGRECWKKGLTKETDDRVLKSAIKCSETMKIKGPFGFCSPNWIMPSLGKEAQRRAGGFRENAGRGKKQHLENIQGTRYLLRSSFEYLTAEWMNNNNVLWVQPKSLIYKLDDQTRRYHPDFFLPEYKIIIETKNDYLYSLQREKMDAVKKYSKYPVIILTNVHMKDIHSTMKNLLLSYNGSILP